MTEDRTKRRVEVWRREIGMGWLYVIEVEPYWMDFKAFRVSGKSLPDGDLLFTRRGEDQQFTSNISEAEASLEGYVKWDGCCELDFGVERPHFCGLDNLDEYVAAMRAVYEIGRDHMARFDAKCAGMNIPPI